MTDNNQQQWQHHIHPFACDFRTATNEHLEWFIKTGVKVFVNLTNELNDAIFFVYLFMYETNSPQGSHWFGSSGHYT